MTFNPEQFLLLGILAAAAHWILARSKITEPLWSRAPAFLDGLLRCAACSGFWLGLGIGALGVTPVAGAPNEWTRILISGLSAVFATPIFEGVLLWGLRASSLDDAAPPFDTDVASADAVLRGQMKFDGLLDDTGVASDAYDEMSSRLQIEIETIERYLTFANPTNDNLSDRLHAEGALRALSALQRWCRQRGSLTPPPPPPQSPPPD